MKCVYCGYEWDYGGTLSHATCPDCQRKTPVESEP